LGAAGCGVDVSGVGDALPAVDLDVLGPGQAQPVAGATASDEFAGLDPVVDDADAAAESLRDVASTS
jgi:hypothetical protein